MNIQKASLLIIVMVFVSTSYGYDPVDKIVELKEENAKLKEQVEKLKKENDRLTSEICRLTTSNGEFRKENKSLKELYEKAKQAENEPIGNVKCSTQKPEMPQYMYRYYRSRFAKVNDRYIYVPGGGIERNIPEEPSYGIVCEAKGTVLQVGKTTMLCDFMSQHRRGKDVLVYVQGVDAANIVDGQRINCIVVTAGTYQYEAASGGECTVQSVVLYDPDQKPLDIEEFKIATESCPNLPEELIKYKQ